MSIEKETRKELPDAVKIIEGQNDDLKDILNSLGRYDFRIDVPDSTYSIIVTMLGDMIRKQETIIELTLSGKYSEASTLLRNLVEECYDLVLLAENPGKWKEFIQHHKKEEERVVDKDVETPNTVFNSRMDEKLEKIDEKGFYRLYRALSQSESHTSLNDIRRNVDFSSGKPKLKIDPQFDEKTAAAILYTSYKHLDKAFWRTLAGSISFYDRLPELPREFKRKRDKNKEFWEDLRDQLDF